MAQDIVSGLFGLSPYEAQMKERQFDQESAMNLAQMGPQVLANYAAASAGQAFGGMLAESQGRVSPEVAQAQARQQALQGLDLSSSQSILAKAATIQDPKMKFGLMQLAEQAKQREITNAEHQARTEEMQRKTATAALEAKRKQEILSNPNTSPHIKNLILSGASLNDIYKTHTVGKDQELGYIDTETGEWKTLAKGKETDKGVWSNPTQLGGATVQKNSVTGEIRTVVSRPPVTTINAGATGAAGIPKGLEKLPKEVQADFYAANRDKFPWMTDEAIASLRAGTSGAKEINKQENAVKKATGSLNMMRNTVERMQGAYDDLAKSGGISDVYNSAGGNAFIWATQTSDFGQSLGRIAGTKNQSVRDSIAASKRELLSQMKNAYGISASEMNSNVELKTLLDSLGDVKMGKQAVDTILANIDATARSYLASQGRKVPGEAKTSPTKSVGGEEVWERGPDGKLRRKQ